MMSENAVLEDKRVYGVKTTTTGALWRGVGHYSDFSPVIALCKINLLI